MAAAVTIGKCGATVSIKAVHGFDKLGLEEATNIIYQIVIPECEKKRVMLSFYGNHNSKGGFWGVKKYNEMKDKKELFEAGLIQRIQRVFSFISQHCRKQSSYNEQNTSYGLKHIVENHIGYITNGEFIVAMLLHGYSARFGKRTEKMDINAQFKVKIEEPDNDSKTKE